MTLTPDIVGLNAQPRLLRDRHEIVAAQHRFAAEPDLHDREVFVSAFARDAQLGSHRWPGQPRSPEERQMHQSMMNEVVEATLAERRREAARQRRIVTARRARAARRGVPTWRARIGRALIAVGSAIGQTDGGTHATPRQQRGVS